MQPDPNEILKSFSGALWRAHSGPPWARMFSNQLLNEAEYHLKNYGDLHNCSDDTIAEFNNLLLIENNS